MPSGFLRSRSASRGGLDDDGEDGGPALGRGELPFSIAALDPGDAEAVGRGADDAGDLDGDLLLADLGEGIVGAGVVVERQRAAVGGEVVGAQPVLPHDDRIGRDASGPAR